MPNTSPARIWSAAYRTSEASGFSLLILTISARTLTSFPECLLKTAGTNITRARQASRTNPAGSPPEQGWHTTRPLEFRSRLRLGSVNFLNYTRGHAVHGDRTF